MQSKSATYNTIIAADNHSFEVKLNINGTDYGQDVIYGAKSDCKVFDTAPTIGGTYSGTLEFSLLGDGSAIPKMASVKPYFRAVLGATTSEWIQKGEFFIDTRSVSHNDNGLTVFSAHCFDAMLKANANYATSSLAWPATDTAVVAEIASKMGVSQDSRNSSILTGGYSIPLPTEYTMRDVLSFIAAMYAANWIITDEGKLRIVPIAGGADTLAVGKSCANLDISTSRSAYTKVIYEIDDETVVESGSTDTNVMEVYNPFGTQTEADAVYSILSAWSYKPFDASGVWSDPCVEVGDQITAVGESGTIYSRAITFGPGMVMELSAPNDNYVDHEYVYESPEERRYTRTVNGLSSSISLNASGIQIVSQKLNNIGGTNLIKNTLEPSVATAADYPKIVGGQDSTVGGTASTATHGIRTTAASNGAWLQIGFGGASDMNGLIAGRTYTFSCDLECKMLSGLTSGSYNINLWTYVNGANDTNYRIVAIDTANKGTVIKMPVSITFTIPSNATAFRFFIRCQSSTATYALANDYIELANIKLERGEVATAWSPAPEDQVGNDEIISKINVSPESIVIAASKVDLQGFVTFTNLSTSGQTTINGANIITGLLQDAAGKNSWNLDTGAFTITDGSINITTSGQYSDKIVLSYTSGNNSYKTSLTPAHIEVLYTNSNTPSSNRSFQYSSRGLDSDVLEPNGSGNGFTTRFYLRNDSIRMVDATTFGITLLDSSIGLRITDDWNDSNKVELKPSSLIFLDSTATPEITIKKYSSQSVNTAPSTTIDLYGFNVYRGNGSVAVVRAGLTENGLTFRNSSNTVTATYPATGLPVLTGATDSTTATGCVYAVPPQTFSSATTQVAAAEALLKYICANYPNKTACTFIGNYITTANRRGYELYISSTSSVDANGVPQYASGFVYEASTTAMLYAINCNAYVVTIGHTLPNIKTDETSDLNNLSEAGVYTFSNAATHNPAGAGGSVITTSYNANFKAQLAFANNNSSAAGQFAFMRRKNSANGWTSWAGIMGIRSRTTATPYNDSVIDYATSSGTTGTYALNSGHTYLVTVARRNSTLTDKDGVWICSAHSTSSHLTALKTPTGTYTISVSALTLSITTWDNYMNISILDMGAA